MLSLTFEYMSLEQLRRLLDIIASNVHYASHAGTVREERPLIN